MEYLGLDIKWNLLSVKYSHIGTLKRNIIIGSFVIIFVFILVTVQYLFAYG